MFTLLNMALHSILPHLTLQATTHGIVLHSSSIPSANLAGRAVLPSSAASRRVSLSIVRPLRHYPFSHTGVCPQPPPTNSLSRGARCRAWNRLGHCLRSTRNLAPLSRCEDSSAAGIDVDVDPDPLSANTLGRLSSLCPHPGL